LSFRRIFYFTFPVTVVLYGVETIYHVFVNGVFKGEVYRAPRGKRWVWFKEGRGKETHAMFTREHVRRHIAGLLRVEPVAVVFRKERA
jgi:hypothetical protein